MVGYHKTNLMEKHAILVRVVSRSYVSKKIKKQILVYQNDECAKKHRNSKSFVEHDL